MATDINGHPTIDLARIALLLRTVHGVGNAYVTCTGGGTATLFAGSTHTDGNGDTRYAVTAGPGWYVSADDAMATVEDLYVGADDDGICAWEVKVTADTTEVDIASMIAVAIGVESA